jgi:hypothetical protein
MVFFCSVLRIECSSRRAMALGIIDSPVGLVICWRATVSLGQWAVLFDSDCDCGDKAKTLQRDFK